MFSLLSVMVYVRFTRLFVHFKLDGIKYVQWGNKTIVLNQIISLLQDRLRPCLASILIYLKKLKALVHFISKKIRQLYKVFKACLVCPNIQMKQLMFWENLYLHIFTEQSVLIIGDQSKKNISNRFVWFF